MKQHYNNDDYYFGAFKLPTRYEVYKNEINEKNSVMIVDDFDDNDARYIFNHYDCQKILVTENKKVLKEISKKEFELYEIKKLCKKINTEFQKCELRNYANLEGYCKSNNIKIHDYLKNLGYHNYFEYKDDISYLHRRELPISEILRKVPKTIKEYIDYPIDDIKKESKLNNSICDSQNDLIYADNEICYYDCHDGDYIFIDTQEAMGFKEETDSSYLKNQILYVNGLSENILQVDANKKIFNEICTKYNLYDCIKENCYIDENFKKSIEGLKEIEDYQILTNCTDFTILEDNLSEEKLKQLEKGLESYDYYQSKYYDDGDIIGEYQNKYGNIDLIDWYEGLMETDDLIKTLNCDIGNEI